MVGRLRFGCLTMYSKQCRVNDQFVKTRDLTIVSDARIDGCSGPSWSVDIASLTISILESIPAETREKSVFPKSC